MKEAMAALLAPHQLGFGVPWERRPLFMPATSSSTTCSLDTSSWSSTSGTLLTGFVEIRWLLLWTWVAPFGHLCLQCSFLPFWGGRHYTILRGCATGWPPWPIALLPCCPWFGATFAKRVQCFLLRWWHTWWQLGRGPWGFQHSGMNGRGARSSTQSRQVRSLLWWQFHKVSHASGCPRSQRDRARPCHFAWVSHWHCQWHSKHHPKENTVSSDPGEQATAFTCSRCLLSFK